MFSRDYVFKEIDGVKIEATVFWKPQSSSAHYGVGMTFPRTLNRLIARLTHFQALGFHGGAFVIGSRYFLPEAEIEYLADAGFVVVSADYRLCPQVALYDVIQDAIDSFAWCKRELPGKLKADAGIEVDGRKIVAFGQSSGGLLALHLVRYPFSHSLLLPNKSNSLRSGRRF